MHMGFNSHQSLFALVGTWMLALDYLLFMLFHSIQVVS